MKTNKKKKKYNKPTKEINIQRKNRAFGQNKAYSSDQIYMIKTQKDKKEKTNYNKKRFLLGWN